VPGTRSPIRSDVPFQDGNITREWAIAWQTRVTGLKPVADTMSGAEMWSYLNRFPDGNEVSPELRKEVVGAGDKVGDRNGKPGFAGEAVAIPAKGGHPGGGSGSRVQGSLRQVLGPALCDSDCRRADDEHLV